MSEELIYRIDTATVSEIADHLRQRDADFLPPLSGRVEIAAYASKLVANAVRFEAWAAGRLVGLIAVYCNDPVGEVAYVSSVSVLKEQAGRGIASTLMSECIEHVVHMGMRRIRLEVSLDNELALRLYERHGFSLVAQEMRGATMELDLIGRKDRYER